LTQIEFHLNAIKVSSKIILSMMGENNMDSKTYGYIRVSPRDQNEDRQKIAMREFGIPHSLCS